jgi:hypothetical protein
MFCDKCGKNLRMGSLFCGKCGSKIPIKCVKCGAVGEEDDMFCIKCGKQLPEDPFVSEDEDASKSPKAVEEPKPAAAEPPKEPVKPAQPPKEDKPEPKPAPVNENAGWLRSGKDLIEFYDVFAAKCGFVIDDEAMIPDTGFMLKAQKSTITIWDNKHNGIKLEGFNNHKDGKRISIGVHIQENGVNDGKNSAFGKDETVIEQLNPIYLHIMKNNKRLIDAIEKCREKFCQ